MIDILKSIIDLLYQFFDGIFFFEIELTRGVSIPIGILFVVIIFVFGAIYLVLKAVGIIGGDN